VQRPSEFPNIAQFNLKFLYSAYLALTRFGLGRLPNYILSLDYFIFTTIAILLVVLLEMHKVGNATFNHIDRRL
jgi:hypothetical protein